jgi:Tol biopolymer transport system component
LEGPLAYLEAVEPLDSVVSRYRLVVMDRDGSNRRVLFPGEDQPGLTPNMFVWSPDGRQIALIYQGNLVLIDVVTGLTQQLTGDGLSHSPRWTE